jgi:hypothetical protein
VLGPSHNNSTTHKVVQIMGFVAGTNDVFNAGTPPGASGWNVGFHSDPQHDRAPINAAFHASRGADDITSGSHIFAAYYSADQGTAANNYAIDIQGGDSALGPNKVYFSADKTGPYITAGTGVPALSAANGSLFFRTDGTGNKPVLPQKRGMGSCQLVLFPCDREIAIHESVTQG